MILPTKHIAPDRALLSVGARVLSHLTQPKTVSMLWEELLRINPSNNSKQPSLRFDAFVLTLDLLYSLEAIRLEDGLIIRNTA